MKQVVCMKWGDKYPPSYVNKLYGMVARNITGPFRFICMTDDSRGIREEVDCMPCPELAIEHPYKNYPWRKISLWNKTLPTMEGDWLFLDLDLVIISCIDEFFEYKKDSTFIVMHNWSQPGSQIGNTSVYRFRVGSHPYLLDKLISDPVAVFTEHPNSQTYVSRTIQEIDFWPDEWCVLFKVQCVPPMPHRWWRTPKLPESAKIVAFPGDPNPDDAMAGSWPSKWYKKIYKTIRPAYWIALYWNE